MRIRAGIHGREYRSWQAAKARCYYTKDIGYARYGARGITMCDAWRESFETFLRDMGPRPPGMTLDRFPNRDGNYEPGNARWATCVEQNNNKRTCLVLTAFGRTLTASQWSRVSGVSQTTIKDRLGRGWSVERCVTAPARPNLHRLLTCGSETHTLGEWSRRTRINIATILSRLDRLGWSAEQALQTPPGQRSRQQAARRRFLTHNGETLSITEWTTRLGGACSKSIAARLDRGWTIERALTTPFR